MLLYPLMHFLLNLQILNLQLDQYLLKVALNKIKSQIILNRNLPLFITGNCFNNNDNFVSIFSTQESAVSVKQTIFWINKFLSSPVIACLNKKFFNLFD